MKTLSVFRTTLVLISILVLSACGGGGTLPSLSGNSNDLTLSISTTSINISALKNSTTPTVADITLAAGGGTVYISISNTQNAIYSSRLSCSSSEVCTMNVDPKSPSSLSAGTYIDTITVLGCSDSNCNSIFQTHTVTVTYTISDGGAFTVTPSSLQFNSISNVVPESKAFDLSYAGGTATTWSASISYTDGNNWLTLSQLSGSALASSSITASVGSLPTGNYSATINIQSNGGTVLASVPVSYTVIDPRSNPAQVSYIVDLNSQAIDLQKSLTVLSNFAGTNTSANWSIASNVNWLMFSQNSGNTLNQNQVMVSVDSSKISSLGNGSHSGILTLSSTTPNVDDWTIPVTLVVNLPQINFVSPYTTFASTTGTVIVRGSGFSGITTQNVMIGSNAATTTNIISDTEIHIGHSSLNTGVYRVAISNQLSIPMSRADLHVISPENYSEAVVGTPNAENYRVIYDSQRQALYVATLSELKRFKFNGASWIADSLGISNLNDIALTPDGKELIAVSSAASGTDPAEILHIDLNSFTISSQVSIRSSDYDVIRSIYLGADVMSLAISNDGFAIIGWADLQSGYLKYNVLNQSIEYLDITGLGGSALTRPHIASSSDGSNLFLAGGNGPRGQTIFVYDASGNGNLQASSFGTSTKSIATDKSGSRVVVSDAQIYDGQFNYQGQYPYTRGATLSFDGTLAYTYQFSSPSYIRIYDLTSSDGSGGFNSGGSDITLSTSPGSSTANLVLTPSESNIFIATSTNIVVRDIP